MLFVTNRTPRQSIRSRTNRAISFDLQDTTASQNLFFCERHQADRYTEIGSREFFQRLKTLPGNQQVILYIHGFNNLGERDIFPRAERLQKLMNREDDPKLVSVVPLIWPCDDDSIVAIADDYWDDQQAADQSGGGFARLLGKFDDWRRQDAQQAQLCTRRINVLAHSMGARVLQNALRTWAHQYAGGNMPQLFRNVFLVAADLVNHTFEPRAEDMFIPDAARNVVVYYANDDLAMPASKVANLKHGIFSRRLGMTGPLDLKALPRNVYSVDCDDFNNTFDPPKGHSYFLDGPDGETSPVLRHMVHAVRSGRVAPAARNVQLSP